jgi:hypothetical protein
MSLVKEIMNMKKLNLALAILLTAVMAGNAATSTSEVVGYNKITFPTGNSCHAATFVKANYFSGAATSKTANSLTVTGASFGSLAPSGGLPQYYVKILSGAMAGFTFDILSNTSTTLVVDGDLSSQVTNPNFVIRPHVMASELFSASSGLTDGLDTISVFNADGTTTTMLRAAGDSPTGWINPVDESAANAVLYPGQGFFLNAASPGNYTFSGTVETSATVVPLFAGAINLVSSGNPGSGTTALESLGIGAMMTPALDTVELFSQDGTLSSQASFLWAGTDGFINPVDESPAVLNLSGNAVLNVYVSASTTWLAPAPYTPNP